VPTIVGTVRNEGNLFINFAFGKPLASELEYMAVMEVIVGLTAGLKVMTQYPVPSPLPADLRPHLADVATDLLFVCPSRNATASAAAAPGRKSPMFLYTYQHVESFNPAAWGTQYPFVSATAAAAGQRPRFEQFRAAWRQREPLPRHLITPSIASPPSPLLSSPLPQTLCWPLVCHSAELLSLFHPDYPQFGTNYTQSENLLSQTMQWYWANMAASGNPGAGSASYPLTWPHYNMSGRPTMLFNAGQNAVLADFNTANCDFFDTQVGYNYY
jgi:carboxylesterase type B